MTKLEQYASFINKTWSDFLNQMSPDKHVFLYDMERVAQEPAIDNTKSNKIKYSLKEYVSEEICLSTPEKILPEDKIIDLYKDFLYGTDPLVWSNVRERIDDISNFLLYPTASLKINMPKNKNLINVLILGGGPTGLFVANYLTSVINKPWANVLVVDNRAHKDTKYRVPYTRNRQFAVNSELFTSFFPRIMTMNDLIGKPIAIKYLEYMLLIILYGNRVPICYTKELMNTESLEKFVKAKSIDIVYDCTGGRLDHHYFDNIESPFPDNLIMSNDSFDVKKHGNIFQLHRKDGMLKRFYLSAEAYENGQYDHTLSVTSDIQYLDDLNMLKVMHNKCFKIKLNKLQKFIKLLDNLKDLELAKTLQSSFLTNKELNIRISIVEAYLQHQIQVATVVDGTFLFISAGDSAFTSHFYIGAGLNRLLNFLISVMWYQQILYT